MQLTAKQEKVLETAVYFFKKKGYAATSVRDIAGHLKIKPASLYAHISSKEQLLNWVYDDVLHRFTNNLNHLENFEGSPAEKFRKMLALHLQEIYRNVDFYDVYITNINNDTLNADQENHQQELKNYMDCVRKIIMKYLQTLPVDPSLDKEELVYFGICIINNIFRWKTTEQLSLEKDVDFLERMFVKGCSGK